MIDRRRFLKAAGVTLALPALESLAPALQASRPASPKLVCVGNVLGFYAPKFFPEKSGKDFDLPHLLEPLAPHRRDLTVFSGLDHGSKGGHFAVHTFLSGVHTADAKSMPEGNISLDQRAAESVGGTTRFPSLAVGSEDGIHGGCMMCWTRSGARVPPIPGPEQLFKKLFVDDDAADRAKASDRLRLQGSILDSVKGDAKSLEPRLGRQDREKLDEYLSSVRDVERQIALREQWSAVPKPKPPFPAPKNSNLVDDLPLLYDLIALALQNGSTRIATLELAGGFNASALDIRSDYHLLSHHGQLQEKIELLVKIERYQMDHFARFLEKLKSLDDGGAPLLDRTMVLFGSGMGNANAHTNLNLPILLAGGRFRHGEHRVYPTKGLNRQPLCNLYLTLLQRFGVETDRFGTSSATLTDFA